MSLNISLVIVNNNNTHLTFVNFSIFFILIFKAVKTQFSVQLPRCITQGVQHRSMQVRFLNKFYIDD